MSLHPFSIARLVTTATLAAGMCVAAPTPAHAYPIHTVSNFSVEIGNDLGLGGYADPTATGGHQCRGTVQIGNQNLVSVTKVSVLGNLSPKPNRAAVHRPGNNGSAKTPSGTSLKWTMSTNEHNGSYVAAGTWTVILSKPQGQTCAVAYDGNVSLKIDGLP